MIPVTSDFKTAARGYVKQVKVYLNDGVSFLTDNDDLQTLKMNTVGGLCKTIMRQAQSVFFGGHNFLDKYVNIGYGLYKPQTVDKGIAGISIASPAVINNTAHGLQTGDAIKLTTTGTLPLGLNINDFFYVIKIDEDTFNLSSTYANSLNNIKVETTGTQSGLHTIIEYPINEFGGVEYANFGKFKVIEQEINEGTEATTVKMFDLMYEALQQYDLTPTFPITMLQLLQLICIRLGWSLLTTSFPNSDLIITSEIFLNQRLSYRDILEDIAEASGSIIYFNNEDKLVVRQVTTTSLDTVDKTALKTLKVKLPVGPIDTVVLSRMPQNDNIAASN